MGCTASKKVKEPVAKEKRILQKATLPPQSPEVLRTPLEEPQETPPTPKLRHPVRSLENLVSAPTALPPQFETTGKEIGAYQIRTHPVDEPRKIPRNATRESSTFHWPSAHEVRAEEKRQTEEEQNVSRMAQNAHLDKAAFLEERNREKAWKRKAAQLDEDADDTLFEQPTRMPDMDFVPDKDLVF